MSHEFPGYTDIRDDVAEPNDGADGSAALHRRQFLALSAAIGASTLAGCRRPDLEILPFANVPEEQIRHVMPGRPAFYATSFPRPGGAFPVLVESHEGRPTKIEGNPQHPASGGAADVHAQAFILDLYSPDRVMNEKVPGVLQRGQFRKWEEFDAAAPALFPANGDGLAVLAEKCPSPAVRLLREQFQAKFPAATWHAYEAFDDTNAIEGAKLAFGKPLGVRYDFAKAERVLALDCDFLESGPDAVRYSREFMKHREAKRLYAVESTYSPTGTMADHRLRLPASRIGDFLRAVAKELKLPQAGGETPGEPLAKWAQAVAKDLATKGLVVVGPRQPAWVHALAFAINARLGTPGEFREPAPESLDPLLADLVAAMNGGKVKTLLILGGNPVFNAPADLKFREALAKVPHAIHHGLYHDQTSEACEWHLPLAHPLESWGDTETSDGTLCCVQPLIAPLNGNRPGSAAPNSPPPRGGRSVLEVLGKVLQAKETAYDWVRQSFAQRAKLAVTDKDFDARFNAYKQLGFLKGSARPTQTPSLNPEALRTAMAALPPAAGATKESLEVTFQPDAKLLDGRFAMNAWLQELPDPITKLTWDNAAIISPRTAAEFRLATSDLVELTVKGRTLTIPVFVLPGQADFSVALLAGQFGEMRITHVPDGGGFDVFAVRNSQAPDIATGCTLKPTGRRYELAVTQEHGEIPEGRDIIREVPASALHQDAKHPEPHADHHGAHPDGAHAPRLTVGIPPDGHITEADLKKQFQGPYGNPEFHGTPGEKQPRFPLELARPEILDSQFQWGMVVDLNACTGCSACMIACQAENNIPVVGKTEIKRNREMHWIRIDRYFLKAEDESPRIVSQPVACVHCEAAPCEQVCPVNAAMHSPEGLNLQVYNRCIGTRYCANACPYKVRRFNWFDFNKRGLDEIRVPTPLAREGMSLRNPGVPETLRMQKNPDVTVRMRGVMEKCTYCVQRLEAAKSASKIAAAEVAQGRRTIAVEDAFRPADGSAYRKPKDAKTAGYDLDELGRVIVPDGFVTTACQQACPTGAIVFGNTRDPHSKVSAAKKRVGEYLLLGELNTKPRTSYLPRVRNVNPELG